MGPAPPVAITDEAGSSHCCTGVECIPFDYSPIAILITSAAGAVPMRCCSRIRAVPYLPSRRGKGHDPVLTDSSGGAGMT